MKYDNIIIGAGISGLILGGYLAQAGQKTLIVDRGGHEGGRFRLYPLHNGGFAISQGPQLWMVNGGGVWTKPARDFGISLRYIVFPQSSIYYLGSHKQPMLNPLVAGPDGALETILEMLPPVSDGTKSEFLKILKVIAELSIEELKIMGDTLMNDWLKTLTEDPVVIGFFANLVASQIMMEVEQCSRIISAHCAAITIREWFMGECFITGIYPDPVSGFIDKSADAFKGFGGEVMLETEVEKIVVKNDKATGIVIKDKAGNTKEIEGGRVISSALFTQLPKLLDSLPDELAEPIDRMEKVQLADYYVFCELSGDPGLTNGYVNILDEKGNNLLNSSPQSKYMPWSVPWGKELTVCSRVYTMEEYNSLSQDEVLKQVVSYQEDCWPGFESMLENISCYTHYPLWHHGFIGTGRLPNASSSIENLYFCGDSVSPQVSLGTEASVSTAVFLAEKLLGKKILTNMK